MAARKGELSAADDTSASHPQLAKAPVGIDGLDQITNGGLPRGRPTLVCGSAGCGKTLLAMEFLVRGATQFDEPGVFMAFEETSDELAQNVRSLGFDLRTLEESSKLIVDFVRVERSEIEETGAYDLEGLFVRLGYAIDSIGAKRVVLDTLESLFSGLPNQAILRAELRRLFRWLKDRGVTAVVTAERGNGSLTRQGLEEYVSDCVILLDHRVENHISTRNLRVVKYRGTAHGTNEYPFLIDEDGFSVLPVTALGLDHAVTKERISSGIPQLDQMLGGEGYFRGSSVLVSGTAGSGKTSMAVSLVHAACARGEKCLYFSFEESPSQIIRNARSIGIDLEPWVEKGLLRFHTARATTFGLEMHLVNFHRLIRQFEPVVVAIDPLNSLTRGGSQADAAILATRLIDFLKVMGITAFLTNLTSGEEALEKTALDISSLVDTWLLLRDVELGGERNRVMYILKSRGMAHSNQVREFLLTDHGVQLIEAYLGRDGVLTGSMRLAQEARAEEEELRRQARVERAERELELKREAFKSRMLAMQKEFEAELELASEAIRHQSLLDEADRRSRDRMAASRRVDLKESADEDGLNSPPGRRE